MATSLDIIERQVDNIRKHISSALELPDPGRKLHFNDCNNIESRIFKRIHQTSMLHAEHFVRSNYIKLTYLSSGYISSCKQDDPISPYLFARSILELAAFQTEVSRRAFDIANKAKESWKSAGEEFFALLVRARFATSDPKKQKKSELSKQQLQPLNIMHCIKQLRQYPNAVWLAEQYDSLCDYVHGGLNREVQFP